MLNEGSDPEKANSNDEAVEVDFDDEVLRAPTALERELGREVDDEETAYIQVAIKVFGTDSTQAAIGFALFCRFRQEYE
jgi:hypothetical protein